MAAAEAHAMKSLSHAMKVLRKQLFAQDGEIRSKWFSCWQYAVARARACRKQKQQNMRRTLRQIADRDEATLAHCLVLWLRSSRGMRRERLLKIQSARVLQAFETQSQLQFGALSGKCLDGWRSITKRDRNLRFRRERILHRTAATVTNVLKTQCLVIWAQL